MFSQDNMSRQLYSNSMLNPRPFAFDEGNPMLDSQSQSVGTGLSNDMLNFGNGMTLTSMGQQNSMLNNAMGIQSQGGSMNGGSNFVPELDMMALLRAKEKLNMMHRGNSVQDKMRAYSQEQMLKNQGLGTTQDQAKPNMESLQVSSNLIDNHLKRSAEEMRSAAAAAAAASQNLQDNDSVAGPSSKKRKKAKKPSDMPRRALSAYNIFFSEQRELILKDIAAKEKGEAPQEGTTKKQEDTAELPSVMNRTFFPTRAKRAHRKVHGKIGLVDLARQVSQRWKALSPEKRRHYQDLAQKDRERHRKIMADYQERKAAENMVSLGSPVQVPEEPPASIPQIQRFPTDQEMRENVAHHYQQKILAEMMAARQQQQPSQQGLGMAGFPDIVSQHFSSVQPSQQLNFGSQQLNMGSQQLNLGSSNQLNLGSTSNQLNLGSTPNQLNLNLGSSNQLNLGSANQLNLGSNLNLSSNQLNMGGSNQLNLSSSQLNLGIQSNDQNMLALNSLQNQRAQMWQQMGMGPM